MDEQLLQLLKDPGFVSVVGDKLIILALIVGLLVLLGLSVGAFGSTRPGGVVPTPGPTPTPEPVPTPVPEPVPTPTPPGPTGDQRFSACLDVTLQWEGGNDDDPRDPGGRTSRGIIQTEWDKWRTTHPGLPSDVWQAPQDQVVSIYRANYWDAQSCTDLPPGIDLVVFDFGVNSGISRSGKLLQQLAGLTGTDVDGEVGPVTISAVSQVTDVAGFINKYCDARMAFLKGLSTWETYGNGWSNRVADVRKKALAMAAKAGAPTPLPTPTGEPAWLSEARKYLGQSWSSGDPPQFMKNLIHGIMANAANRDAPGFQAYCTMLLTGHRAWCGIFAAGVLSAAGKAVPFDANDEEKSFAWAAAWDDYGIAVVGDAQAGDILRFAWHGGGAHVTFYEGLYENDNYYHCLGGNQSDAVTIAKFIIDDTRKATRRPA